MINEATTTIWTVTAKSRGWQSGLRVQRYGACSAFRGPWKRGHRRIVIGNMNAYEQLT